MVNVLFTNDSRFGVQSENTRITICRERDTRNNRSFVHGSDRFGGVGVMFCADMAITGRTDLCINRNGLLTAQRFRDENENYCVPYGATIGVEFVLIEPGRSNRWPASHVWPTDNLSVARQACSIFCVFYSAHVSRRKYMFTIKLVLTVNSMLPSLFKICNFITEWG